MDPQFQGFAPAAESSARPKVLRRPQQFSRKPSANGESEPLAASPLPSAAPVTVTRPAPAREPAGWQEDGRFGMMLILTVALINLLLALILPMMHKSAPERAPATHILGGAASMPAPTSARNASNVTVYSEPNNEPNDRMDLESLPEDYNDFATRPEDMPAPTARSMDAAEQ